MVTSARRAGYRLLGSWFDYLLHTRPAEWPIVTAHTLVGYVLAVGLGGLLRGERLGPAALGAGLWVVCLNGGTLALNSAYDQDEGDVAYLRRPPPAPMHLGGFGFTLMAVGLVGAFQLPPAYGMAYSVCLGMSVLYSVPPIRLKAVPGADWAVNMLGFGTLTPLAGWAATGLPITSTGGFILLAFGLLFAGLYPLTQIYQFEEDERRGDRTLARSLGVTRSLLVSLGAVVVALVVLALAGARAGWGIHDPWRWSGLGLCALAWAAVLLPWLRGRRQMGVAEHQRGMYRALLAWAVTDVVVVLAWGT